MEKPAGSKGLPLPMGAVASSNGALLPGAVLPGLGLNAPPAEQNTANALERHEQELSRMEAEQQAKEEQELLGMSMMFSLAEQQQQQQQQQQQPQASQQPPQQQPRPDAQARRRCTACPAAAFSAQELTVKTFRHITPFARPRTSATHLPPWELPPPPPPPSQHPTRVSHRALYMY